MISIIAILILVVLGYPTSALERYSKEWNETALITWQFLEEFYTKKMEVFTLDMM